MVRLSKNESQHINMVFNEHRRLHFDPRRPTNLRRALKAFRLNFFTSVIKRGGTGSAADEVLRLQKLHYAHNTASYRSLCIQYPFARGVVTNTKHMELRKTEVPDTLNDKTKKRCVCGRSRRPQHPQMYIGRLFVDAGQWPLEYST